MGDRDADDLRQNASALFPPEYYVAYLQNPEVMARIGAEVSTPAGALRAVKIALRSVNDRCNTRSAPTRSMMSLSEPETMRARSFPNSAHWRTQGSKCSYGYISYSHIPCVHPISS